MTRPVGVRQKFTAAIGVLVTAVLVISAVAIVGMAQMIRQENLLFVRDVATAQHSADLVIATLNVHEAALYELATVDSKTETDLAAEMNGVLLPAVQQAVFRLRADVDDTELTTSRIETIDAGLRSYLRLREKYVSARGVDAPATEKSELADQTDEVLEDVVNVAKGLSSQAQQQEVNRKRTLDATYRTTQRLLLLCTAFVLMLALLVAMTLSRSLLPRIKQYAAFATDVAEGRAARLVVRGNDELTTLGTALNDMVGQRERAGISQSQQTEFVEMVQVVGSEDEAHLLIQRHIERSITACTVLVLKRNNSANRLEAAVTGRVTGSMAGRLVGAEPRSCVALRLGQTHSEGDDGQALLRCDLCGNRETRSTCEPLLISGEVIGSVLVSHDQILDQSGRTKIKSTVAQASPMLANLRNLALAQFRANNDLLTGLPNKRATEDSLKRLVARANHLHTPLSAVMLDLDHFKEINDRFGHPIGDDVLAAIGPAIASCLRDGDFAGRFGGEEFLVLLPDTNAVDAKNVAEKIRRAIAAVTVPGVDRYITASLGVAELVEHAGTSVGLLRGADRAQYAAKAAGRNRVVLAKTPGQEMQIPEQLGSSRDDAPA